RRRYLGIDIFPIVPQRGQILTNRRLNLAEIGKSERLVSRPHLADRVSFQVLVPKLVEMPVRNQVLLREEGVHDLTIASNRPVLHLRGVPLQAAVLHPLSHRMARRLENRVGISVNVNELRIGEDTEEEPDSPGMEGGLEDERLAILT